MNLDYTPLDQKITYSHVHDIMWKNNAAVIILVAMVYIGVIGYDSWTIWQIGQMSGSEGFAQLYSVMITVLVLGAPAVGYWLVLRRKRDEIILRRFAKANNLSVLHGKGKPGYSGLIFDEGHERRILSGFRDKAEHPIEIGNYEFVTGSGRYRTAHRYGYVKISTDSHFPHLVIDSAKNNLFGIGSLPDAFARGQKVDLEGDFNSHFTVYAPKKYERDLLYLFTPDVMMYFIDRLQDFDVEFVDNEMYLYRTNRFALTSSEEIKALYALIDGLRAEVGKQSSRYRDERVGSGRVMQPIAEQGRRLVHTTNWVTVAIIIILILLHLFPYLLMYAGMAYNSTSL